MISCCVCGGGRGVWGGGVCGGVCVWGGGGGGGGVGEGVGVCDVFGCVSDSVKSHKIQPNLMPCSNRTNISRKLFFHKISVLN